MFASLDGAEALEARLAALPGELRARLEAKARGLADALLTKIRDEKLSGQALESKSGALKASIVANVSVTGDGVAARVGSNGDVKYAAIQEYGGQTSAHDIVPDKAQVLAFLVGGGARFARIVHHPGSNFPARGYLQSSLDELHDEIVGGLGKAINEAWGS